MIDGLNKLSEIKEDYLKKRDSYKKRVLVCGGAGCISSKCEEARQALLDEIERNGLSDTVRVETTGCMGLCAAGPLMVIEPDGVLYTEMTPAKVADAVQTHLLAGKVTEEYTYFDSRERRHIPLMRELPFYDGQLKIALRNCGIIEHDSLEAYISNGGYHALEKALAKYSPQEVIDEVKSAGLRGRGGAGFPTGVKWQAGLNAREGQKYIVCNADEGDPGAFMDRSILEGDPHSIIEGMLIGGYAIGADNGYVYVRAEYPLAIERLSNAINQAREAGLLGKNILGSLFSFDLNIRIGAGAFVCGEETSLLSSIEGKRGEPRQKPPFPFESGLFGQPTIINNVETFANIAPIILNGSDWYSAIGTEKSKGTKVFALAGNIINSGIIEVPMGTVLGDIVYKYGGGIIGGKAFKAIQSGGPSGGCLTAEHLNVRVDYESLASLGAIMGSGGLIVMNKDTCMVDTARYFLDFIQDESCGKCLPCRVGSKRMLEILERITQGKGKPEDIDLLRELSATIQKTAVCQLGGTAPNPVLSTMRFFLDEYESHIRDKHCDCGVCSDLYTAPCSNACPAGVNVPGYMALVIAGRFDDAYGLIRRENPFPAVCGRICTHPCESRCRRSQVDEAISICSIKRFVGDYAMRDGGVPHRTVSVPPTGKRVAVIGSGPSGLTCAYYLAHLGHKVDVYEADGMAGGVLNWGIPEYRLPVAVLEREINAIRAAGVNIITNTHIGRDISFADLRAEHDAVYIAIGAQVSRKLGVNGEDFDGVESGLAYLRRVGLNRDRRTPEKLAVVGGGSTAFDVARTALRLGSKDVTVVYRRTRNEIPAADDEIDEALEEGVKIEFLTSPVEIIGEHGKVTGIVCKRRQKCGRFSRDGRHNTESVPGSDFVIPCDGIVTAVNQEPIFEMLTTEGTGSLDIDRFTSGTGTAGVFVGGDASPWGENVVIDAIASGKRAAAGIDKYLGGAGVLNKGDDIDIPDFHDEEAEPHNRFPTRHLSAEERSGNFKETERGYHKLDAMAEALRCLRCDRR